MLSDKIADNIFFKMAYTNLRNKNKLSVYNLFKEAYRLLNYIEKYKIKI